MTEAEFPRAVRIDTIGQEPRAVAIAAEPAERAALARRFGLVAIDRLEAEARLARKGEEVTATGRMAARVTQSCAATGAPIEAELDERFELLFRPPPPASGPDEEVELGEQDLDILFHDGATIDLGQAVADTLALTLDPFPRAPGAEAALREAGVRDEDAAAPEGPLAAALRDKLGK